MLKKRRLNIFVKQMRLLSSPEDDAICKALCDYVFNGDNAAAVSQSLTEFQNTLPLVGLINSCHESPLGEITAVRKKEGQTERRENDRKKKKDSSINSYTAPNCGNTSNLRHTRTHLHIRRSQVFAVNWLA